MRVPTSDLVRVPRASGDEPRECGTVQMGACVFPARVGMNRKSSFSLRAMLCVPRASGDEPQLRRILVLGDACSPREWG